MKRDYYVTPKAGPIMRMLWTAAGGDRYILERATYSDQVKYACLGGIIFATGGIAALAGGYAFYTIFSPKTADVLDKTKMVIENTSYVPTHIPTMIISIILGLIWGLIIFNIDRFIVTSTGKGDGTEAITWDEFKSAIPRIIMGTIIAFTISKPIEIRMFKSEIDNEIKKEQTKEIENAIKQAKINYELKSAELKKKLGGLQNQIDIKEADIASLRKEVSKEITGANGNGANYGPRAKELERIANELEQQVKSLKNQDEYKQALITMQKYQTELDGANKDGEQNAASLDGLLIRIKKAHELSPWVSFFITLLFLAIELTPIFFKLMLTKTPYDYLAENRDDLIKAESGIEVRYDYYKDKDGLERHLVINHSAEKMIYEKQLLSTAEKVLNRYAIQKYIENEKKKIDENPENYIKHNTENNEDKFS